jgi:hypothetical protein
VRNQKQDFTPERARRSGGELLAARLLMELSQRELNPIGGLDRGVQTCAGNRRA